MSIDYNENRALWGEAGMKIRKEEIDRVFAEWDRPDSPGCALALIGDGGILYERGYGMANLEYDVPITPETIFHVASVSKQFTAMALAMLAGEGKLSLDDDVRRHVPELHDFEETITLRHLVHHTSGLRDQWMLLVLSGWRMDDVITTEDAMDVVRRQRELNFKPGEEHLYCNTGYTLMAIVVERVSGLSFPEFCTERIFRPLSMKKTHFHDDHTRIVKNRAYSYVPNKGNGFKHSVLSYATVGPTSLFTTVRDLGLWEKNFYEGHVGGKALLEAMQVPGVLNDGRRIAYASGLSTGEYRGLKTVSHGGADAGFRSHLMRFPGPRFSIALLGNLSSLRTYTLVTRVADICLADEFPEKSGRPGEETPPEISGERLAENAGLYLNRLTGRTLRTEVVEGALAIRRGEEVERLEPLAPDRFRHEDFPQIEIRFGRSAKGGVLEVHERADDSKPAVYEEVEPWAPTPEEMASFEGDYFCPELEVRDRVILREEGLWLERRKYGGSALRPTTADRFATEVGSSLGIPFPYDIVFTRDEEKRITGFEVNAGRVRNLRYVRAVPGLESPPAGT